MATRLGEDVIANYKAGKYNIESPQEQSAAQTLGITKEAYDSYTKPQEAPSSLISDLGSKFTAGTLGTLSALSEVGEKAGVISPETSRGFQDSMRLSSEDLRKQISPENKKAFETTLLSDKKGEIFNPDYSFKTALGDVAESAPATLSTIAGTIAASPVLGAAAGAVGLSRLGVAIASKFPTIGKWASGIVPNAKTEAEAINHLVGSSTVAGSMEGLISAGQAATDKRQEALNTPIEKLQNSSKFQELFNSMDQTLPIEERQSKAREVLAEHVADDVFKTTFGATAGLGALTGGGAVGSLARAFSKEGKKSISSGLITAFGKGAAEEMFQELPQSMGEQLASNAATKEFIDPTKDITEGVLEAGCYWRGRSSSLFF
jgi:hypothetical protein